jgi:transposase, IS30 family
VDTFDRASGLVGRSAYPWDGALGVLRRRVDTSSAGSPPARGWCRCCRAPRTTCFQREEISRGIAAGLSARSIARRINRPSSAVSREIARNGGRDAYRGLVADAAAFERARRPKSSKLAANPEPRGVVADKLDDDWSPQQIAQWLWREYLDDAAMRISHESIYRDVYMPSPFALARSTTVSRRR